MYKKILLKRKAKQILATTEKELLNDEQDIIEDLNRIIYTNNINPEKDESIVEQIRAYLYIKRKILQNNEKT